MEDTLDKVGGSEVDYSFVSSLISSSGYCLWKASTHATSNYPGGLLEKILLFNHQLILRRDEVFFPGVGFLEQVINFAKTNHKDSVAGRNVAETGIDLFKSLAERATNTDRLDLLINVIKKVPGLNFSKMLPRELCAGFYERMLKLKELSKFKSGTSLSEALLIIKRAIEVNEKKRLSHSLLVEGSTTSYKTKVSKILDILDMPNRTVCLS